MKFTPINVSIVSYSEPIDLLLSGVSSVCEALSQIERNSIERLPKIIIVDNSEDGRIKKSFFDGIINVGSEPLCEIHVLNGHGNIGYGRGHNLAFESDFPGYHLFMNPDVLLEKQALKIGIDYLENHPDVGLATPGSVDGNGEIVPLCKRRPTVFDLFLRGFAPYLLRTFRKRNDYYEMQDLSKTIPSVGIPIASGCFMLVQNKMFEELRGFDPSYFLYFEDFDLSLRLNEISKIVYLPAMRIKHFGGHSATKGIRHVLYFVRSGIRFFNCHGWRWIKQE